MRFLALFLVIFSPIFLQAQLLSGSVKDTSGAILPFATLTVKGTSRGVTANAEGHYALRLGAGNYTLVCEHVGYGRVEKNVSLSEDQILDFSLSPQQLSVKELVIKTTDEDPAYGIIRHAIKKRLVHLKELESFRCMVYSKGKAGLYSVPKSIFGQKIPQDTNYIGKNTTIYMSEVVARYAESPPDKQKAEVISTKVSGQSNGYGATIPYIVSFYHSIIDLGTMNPRGFVSPIAENALHYYRYKLVGTYFEDGRMIDQIRVTPRRSFEPCFSGNISIVDGEWRIHSTDLYLTKSSQLELLDTFHMQQLYAPLDSQSWIMRSQVGFFTFKLLGFDGGGSVANIYSDFELHPTFPKGYFGNTTLKYDLGSNKKPETYWDTIRPVPLTPGEARDYHKKDSLEKIQETPQYLDSVDKANNRVTLLGLFVTGVNINRSKTKETLTMTPLTSAIGFNTVEGPFANVVLNYQKRYGNGQSLELNPDLRYGFSNEHFGAALTARYKFSLKFAPVLEIAGGRTVFQYDPDNPILPIVNTSYTLFEVANYMKIYEASFGRIKYSKDLGKTGLRLSLAGEWQNRVTLSNTDTATYWIKSHGKAGFTPNYPPPFTAEPMAPNRSSAITFTAVWHPGMHYIEYPESLVPLGSKYPTVTFSYTKGISGLFGSDADYDKWRFTVSDNVNLRIGGLFKYNLGIGGFINNRSVALPDYNHFNGNQTELASGYLGSFQLAPYYLYSNTDHFYAVGYIEHHFAGLLTNKIPLFRRLNWYLVGGVNYLYLSDGRVYTEVLAGLENIFKALRIDYVWGLPNGGHELTGLRVGLKIGP